MIVYPIYTKFQCCKSKCNQTFQLLFKPFPLKSYGSGADGIGELGRGAGRGGGGGGKVRESGGALGVRGAVQEEEYFYKLQQQQLEDLKKQIEEQNAENEKRIEELKKTVEKNADEIEELRKSCTKLKKQHDTNENNSL